MTFRYLGEKQRPGAQKELPGLQQAFRWVISGLRLCPHAPPPPQNILLCPELEVFPLSLFVHVTFYS